MHTDKLYEWGEGVFTLLSWFKQDKVKNAKVLVVGAGALGNEVVKNLTLFGVGRIYVCDFDRIELTNLTRSVLFREEDAYKHAYKSEIAAKRAMEINPQIKVFPIVGNLFSEVGLGLYKDVDVVIGCLDSRIARYLLNRLCMRAGKAWIDGSIENMTGVVKIYAPGVNCYECNLSREEFNHIMLRTGCADVVRTQASAGRVATTPISASIVGAMQAQEAMKIIHMTENEPAPFKTLLGKMWRFEGMTNSINTYKYASWKNNCPAHEQWSDIITCNDLSANMKVGDVLTVLKSVLDVRAVEINMRNNKFIEKIISDRPEKEFKLNIPESKLEETIQSDEELRKLSYRTVFHKCFYENIDEDFPFKELTLKEIGIPLYDIIQVSTEKGVKYVELSKDAEYYGL
ncbi:HesA/MoeB/ThiF family protein [Xylanibacter muris]|uniref:ThiF family adenylyltransferase n=1 Tax=Xylanibacter muris TaxID=2736290 RepID=A0ABX2ALR6_9BACT|nr:ThiF family adenylyltransferase [Xylanibacter muris]NPD91725.1 ThiF family adenylyltransferase [Xylanibacter muris]